MANFPNHYRTVRLILKITLEVLKLILLILIIFKKFSELS